MNETTIYPFLSGYLESILRGICTDEAFAKMHPSDRVKYVNKRLAEANTAAKEFAEKYS